MTDKPLRVILWVAVSSRRQATEDKMSLVTQEADQRAIAERNGWQIVDILRVPGHTRKAKDINKLAAAMLKKGIDAYAKLIQYFESMSFDVLVVRDGSRFARTQALHSFVTETTIEDVGARIYSLADGWVDGSNMRMWIAMSGFASASEIDNLKKRHKFGMIGLLESGKPVSSLDTLTHRKVRDKNGKAYTYAIREDTALAWQVIIDAFLDGQSYNAIARTLHENAIPPVYGDAWYPKMIGNALLNPITWGHIARYYHRRYGIWSFDVAAELPHGVLIKRDTHPPRWTGELAIQIQNELRRRNESARGRAWPQSVDAFSGLIYCGCCGKRMTHRNFNNWEAYTCPTRYNTRTRTYAPPCSCEKKSITVDVLQPFISGYLEYLLTERPNIHVNKIVPADSVALYETELAEVGAKLGGLYVQRSTVPVDSVEYLVAEIIPLEARVTVLKTAIARLQHETALTRQQAAAKKTALAALRKTTVDGLWKLAPHRINQILHAVFAGTRVYIVNGEIDEVR